MAASPRTWALRQDQRANARPRCGYADAIGEQVLSGEHSGQGNTAVRGTGRVP